MGGIAGKVQEKYEEDMAGELMTRSRSSRKQISRITEK